MKNILLLLIAMLAFYYVDAQTIYMVRHGEKSAAEGVDLKNPPLSEAGIKRSFDLQNELANKKIEVVYVTNTIRSKQTAEQVLKSNQLEPVLYQPMPTIEWVKELIESKKNVLIVAHSNTISHIFNLIKEAMGQEQSDFEHGEDVYDTLYTFNVKNPKKFKITMVKYGEPSL